MTLFKGPDGQTSMMRVLAFAGFVIGTGVIVAGLVGWGSGLPNAAIIIGTGAGLAGGGELIKMLQRKHEK